MENHTKKELQLDLPNINKIKENHRSDLIDSSKWDDLRQCLVRE